jgi:hypothetical protein
VWLYKVYEHCQGTLTGGGRLSTVDLLVLPSLEQLLFILKILFTSGTNEVALMKRSTVLSTPLQLVFLALRIQQVVKAHLRFQKGLAPAPNKLPRFAFVEKMV